jgi:hypothetical protein
MIACSGSGIFGQTLKEKLDQKATFIPRSVSPIEQLIEIAHKFEIPMAIEWLTDQDAPAKPSFDSRPRSVGQHIQRIIEGRRANIEGGVLHVFSPAEFSSLLNFLNLRIPNYEVKNESLLGADAWLRTKINMLLYPQRYQEGYGGGYGSAPDDPFWAKNINISGENLTIREILNRIVQANGNALWVVTLDPNELRGNKPKWEGVPPNQAGHSPLNYRWKFISLKPSPPVPKQNAMQ